jgi:YVTN family beta-propeller protein
MIQRCRWFFIAGIMASGCGDLKEENQTLGFPSEVGAVFKSSCATPGCHLPDEHDLNKLAKSQHLQGELDLSSWTGLFKGGESGAAVVPFASQFSHLLDHIEGRAEPRMPPNYPPYNRDTLAASQVDVIRTWIDAGAPAADGTIPFSDVTKKAFTTNQTEDVVSVIDLNTFQTMRIFEVGDRVENESPHGIQVSPDGQFFYVSMIVTGDVFKYSASTGVFVDKTSLADPVALIRLNSDGTKLYVTTNFQVNNTGQNGSISVIRTSDMVRIDSITVGISPHGIQLSRDGKYIYATGVYSDRVYVIDTQTDSLVYTFDVADDVGPSPVYEPYHVGVGPANGQGFEDYVFITCRGNGQVRIFQRTASAVSAGTLVFVTSLNVGANANSKPIQLEITPDGNKIFVANSNDSSVTVIQKSGASFTVQATITNQIDVVTGRFHRLSQPNGVTVTADGRYALISNRNKNSAVPPHHGGSGGPGLLTVIDVATHAIVKTIEMEPDCYSVVTYEID